MPVLRTRAGETSGGRAIEVVALGSGPAVLILGGMHGDEPQSAAVAEQLADLLAREPRDMRHCVVFVPSLNPDGLAAGTRHNGRGVDLNRNFPAANWAAGVVGDPYYGGSAPASEPETRVVLDLLENERPQRILALHCIDGGRECVNFDGPARELAHGVAALCGTPVTDDIGYPTPGSLGTLAGRERGIPTLTLEMPAAATTASCWATYHRAILHFIGHVANA